ncbi:MAG: PDZ domain-containing protein [bacterium]
MNRKSHRLSEVITALMVLILIQIVFASCGPQNPRSRASDNDEQSWIGVYVQNLDKDMRRYLDIKERHGVLINDVAEDSPAEEAGLREEDVIIRFDGKRIRNNEDLTRAIRRKEPGDKVKIEIIRDGEKKKVELKIGERPREYSSRFYRRDPRPYFFPYGEYRRPWLGIRMADLNEDLAEYFKVDERDGVLILSVEEDSPAEDAELKAGDIITQIDDEKIRDREDIIAIIEDKDIGDEIEIKFIRKGNEQTVKAELARAPKAESFYFDKERFRDWRDELREWKDKIKYDLKYKIKRDIEKALDHKNLIEDIERELSVEMEKLAEELQNLEIHPARRVFIWTSNLKIMRIPFSKEIDELIFQTISTAGAPLGYGLDAFKKT